MATLPALVDAIAKVDGRERKTLEHTARLVREAGFIPTGKRGGGAAEMDFTAAANLLIGLNGAETPKEAVSAISVIRALEGGGSTESSLPDPLIEIGSARTFGEALEKLIEQTPRLILMGEEFIYSAYWDEKKEEAHNEKTCRFMFREMISGSSGVLYSVKLLRTFATISMVTPGCNTEVQWEARYYFNPSNLSANSEFVGRAYSSDRTVTIEFGLRTLLTVWECVTAEKAYNRELVDKPNPRMSYENQNRLRNQEQGN